MTSPRFILYTRVSTQAQDQNNSHPTQLAALRMYAEKKNADIVDIIRETASGGTYLGRPGIRTALELLENDEADVLACYDFSRYSRDSKHQLAMLERVEAIGKRIEFTTLELSRDENGELTPEGHLIFGVMGSFADHHRRKIKADTTRGLRHAAESGRQPRRKPPHGFHIVTRADVLAGRYAADLAGKYLIVEPAASLVREIFALRAGGASVHGIARKLNERGEPTPQKAKLWSVATLMGILENEAYIGRAGYGKRRRIKDESRLERGLKTDFSVRNGGNKEIPIQCPRIIDEATWNAVAALEGAPLGDRVPRYLLSSLLRCPACNGPMNGVPHKRSAYGYAGRGRRPKGAEPGWRNERIIKHYYRCREAHAYSTTGLPKTCRHCAIYEANPLDLRVLASLRQLLETPHLLEAQFQVQERKELPRIGELKHQLSALAEEEGVLIEGQMRLIRAGAESGVYDEQLVKLSRTRRIIRTELEALEKSNRSTPQSNRHARQLLEDVGAYFDAPDILEPQSEAMLAVRAALRVLLERIEFDPAADTLKLIFRV
ncbi:recombinase family protein [bacterium]|nr:MAG: recombinase family protein [bacterium]